MNIEKVLSSKWKVEEGVSTMYSDSDIICRYVNQAHIEDLIFVASEMNQVVAEYIVNLHNERLDHVRGENKKMKDIKKVLNKQWTIKEHYTQCYDNNGEMVDGYRIPELDIVMTKELAEYVVKLHNDHLNSLNKGEQNEQL